MRSSASRIVAVTADIAFMIDQSHNVKGKMEAMVQTVMIAQELFLKAALVDREQLVCIAGGRQNRGGRRVPAIRILDRRATKPRRVAHKSSTAS